MMDGSRLAADEYEKQYFGFSSTEFTEDFKDHVIEVIKKALTDVKIAISEETGSSYDEETLDTIIQQLYEAYLTSAQSSFKRFEAEARTIFAIPKNVLLEEDKLRQKKYTDEDIKTMKCELTKLETEFIQAKVFLAKCKQLKEHIENTLKPVYEKVNTLISHAKRMHKYTDVSEEANQQKILKVHDIYVQHYFKMMTTDEKQYRSSIITDFKTGDFNFN